jgi:hypothetical protein
MNRPVHVVHPKTGKSSYEITLLGDILVSRWSPAPIWALLAMTPGVERPVRAAIQKGYGISFSNSQYNMDTWYSAAGRLKASSIKFARQEIRSEIHPDRVDHVQLMIWQPDFMDPIRDPEKKTDVKRLVMPSADNLLLGDDVGATALNWVSSWNPSLSSFPGMSEQWTSYADYLALYLLKATDAVILPGTLPRILTLALLLSREIVTWAFPYQVTSSSLVDSCQIKGTSDLGYAAPMLIDGTRDALEMASADVVRAVAIVMGHDALLSQETPGPEFFAYDPSDVEHFREVLDGGE